MWWDVLLDGATHGCELPDDEPPEVGQVRALGEVTAEIYAISTRADGKPLIHAKRVEKAV